jgi:DNA primase
VLYNLHRAAPLAGDKGLVLVEGFFAVMKLYEAGFQSVVACMGCELSEQQAALLENTREVIVLFDGDPAGRHGAEKARELLVSKTVVRVAGLPDGTQPDMLSPRALAWLLKGMQALDLGRVDFSFRTASQAEPEPKTEEDDHG